jgi:UrcA family protein
MSRIVLSSGLVLASLLAAVQAPAASAQAVAGAPDDGVRRVTVSVRDIDFRQPDSVDIAYKRLQFAARQACDTVEAQPNWRTADNRACEREAVAGAVRDLGQPLLTALDSRASDEHLAARGQRR